MSDHLLSKYKANCEKYEWLRIRVKRSRGRLNLNAYLRYDKTYYLDFCSDNIPEGFNNETTTYILSLTTKSLFVLVLRDTNIGHSHTVRINSGLKITYDCMETHELILNVQNLNKCCGPNKILLNVVVSQKLKNNRAYAKKT